MATYKFPQFNLEIVDPTILMVAVHDNVLNHTCSVDMELTSNGAKFGVNLPGFTYSADWNDAEVEMWAFVELQQYEV